MLTLNEILAQIEKAMAEHKNNYELPPETDKPEIKDTLKRLGFWIIPNNKQKFVYWK